MKKENLKRKDVYELAEVEIVLFEFSDIVTQSGGETQPGDWDDWTS